MNAHDRQTDSLSIRAKPRPVRRFNRNALIVIAGAAALFVSTAAMIAFRDEPEAEAEPSTDLYTTGRNPLPDQLTAIPADYSEVTPKLGPPLPGDLGPAFLGPPQEPIPVDNPFQYQRPANGAVIARPTQQVVDAGVASPLFFVDNDRSQQGVAPAVGSPSIPSEAFDQLTAFATPRLANQQTALPGTGDPDPNRQVRKEAFLDREVDEDIYNPHSLQTPVSPYQVMAGTIIPASLVTGLNSDLPGQVIAQVTQHIYDTPTGQHLLIPQGSRLIGQYDSVIAFGQSRALVTWSRIIMPDGTSMVIENLPGADLSGFAGLKDRVDNHTLNIFKAAILSTVLSIGSELGRDTSESDLLEALRDGGQRTFNQAGQRIVNQQLNVQPTIKVRPGWRLNVIVNKDLVLQPYGA